MPEYRAKKEADGISYGWDSMIDRAHEGSKAYERLARELARPNRFTRRVLSQSFYEAYCEAQAATLPILRRLTALGDTTYCFLFMSDREEPRRRRQTMLALMCYVARGLYPNNQRVIGVATEAENRSYDFCVRVQPEWTPEDEEAKDRIQAETGIFVNPRRTMSHEDEYPKSAK